MAPLLEATDLYRFFHAGDDETLALRGVSLAISGGELVSVTGPSGSGKSTLLSCLAGLDDPDGGVVRVAGERISRRTEPDRARLRAQHVGMLFQQQNLIGHLSVEENLALSRKLAGREAGVDEQGLLERCQIDHRRTARPAQLSGGELARAGLANALANAPDVLLADEPTGELDTVTAGQILDLLRSVAEAGSAVLVVTHSNEVAERADRTIKMHDGRIA